MGGVWPDQAAAICASQNRFFASNMASKNNFSPLPTQAPPAWLAEDNDASNLEADKKRPMSSVGSVATVNNPSHGVELDAKEKSQARMVWYGMKIITMVLCVMIFAAAVISLKSVSLTSSGQVFVAVYMIFFSALLFTFEAMQSQPIVWLDHMLRRNFGFLYSAIGKSAFIVFIAFLCLGLDGDLPLATGILTAAFAFGSIALWFKYPKLFEYSPLEVEPPIGTDVPGASA